MRSNKIFSLLLLATLLQGTFGFTGSAEALFGISIPTPSQIADQFEKRYNLSLESIQDQAQTLNVASNKQLAPQVSVIFDPSDPRPGQRLTAKAFPLYFNGPAEQLYYTWYLQRAGCSLDRNPSESKRNLCDEDSDRRITVEDWKIAAMGEIARNGFNNEDVSYSTDNDNDGYQARFGGSSRVNTPNHCYIHDNQSGEDYEIVDNTSDTEFSCADGRDPVCVVTDQVVESGEIPANTGGNSSGGETFEVSEGTACFVSGYPICSSSGGVSCTTGTPSCIDRSLQNDCGQTLSSCSTTGQSSADPICRHLFPSAPDEDSGDGSFDEEEERFWRTNPNDDSTAENGNKDEANIVGLGRGDFTWNYGAGDQVGVVVEGTSMFPTKHDDSSFMIMWAFSKNDCPLSVASGTGSYTKNVRNFQITFPTASIDLDDCLERNLVDPTLGGQSTNLDLQLITSPENPVNDETADQGGDIITAQVLIDNAQKGVNNQYFDWRIEISNNAQFNNAVGRVADITDDLLSAGLVRQVKGAGVDTLEVSLNMDRGLELAGRSLSEYLAGDQGFLRISTRVSENFSSGIVRKGRTDRIVTFTSTQNKIIAYKAEPVLAGEKMRVRIPGVDDIICQDARVDRAICRVVQNEIIGLKIDNSDLTNFQWSINDTPLICQTSNVSPDCRQGEPNEVNFFPVSGNPGSSYTVSVTANDIVSGKTVTLSRLFQVVEPSVNILSADPATVTPKFLGQYRDIQADAGSCPDGFCNNYSKNVFQGSSGEIFKLKPLFTPSFLSKTSQIEWEVNGNIVSANNPNELSIDATESQPGQIVNVLVRGVSNQSDDTRRALIDTWGISQLDSSESRFEEGIQIEVMPPAEPSSEEVAGIRRYLAAFGTYIPETLLYTIRIFLSGSLVLFVAAMAFVFLPEATVAQRPVRNWEDE